MQSEVKLTVSARDNASKVLADVRQSMTRLEEVSSKLGNVLSLLGVVSVGGLVAAVRTAVDGVDAFNDLSDATGASIENISALEDVATRTGTSFGAVESSLIKFNSALKDAKPGSDAEAALKALGLSVKDLKDLDPAQALLKTSQALAGFADDANKARLVQELFGKSLKEVAPFLKDLAEQGELVAKVNSEQAAEAEKFNKSLSVMQANVNELSREFSINLVTSIGHAAKAWKESGFVDGLQAFFGGDDQHKNNVTLVRQTDELLALENEISRLKSSGAAVDLALARKKGEELKLLQEEIQVTLNYRKVLAGAIGNGEAGQVNKPSVGYLPEKGANSSKALRDAALAASRAQDERMRAGRELATIIGNAVVEGNDMYAKLQAEEARIADAEARRTSDYLRSLEEELTALAKGNDEKARQIEEIGLTTEELNKLRLSRQDSTIAQLEATRATAEANGLSYEEISILEQKIELLKQQRELTARGQATQAAVDTRADQQRASKEFADTLKGDLKGAFSAAFRDSSGDPLQAFGDALENIMFTRAATALSEAAMESLGSYLGGSGEGGGISDFISSILSFDGGGGTGNGARTGGLDGKGGFMALLHPQETVLDHTKGQASTGGGAVNVSIVNHIDSRTDLASIQAVMEQTKQQTINSILQSRRQGGVFS